jgi:hypothetical protein
LAVSGQWSVECHVPAFAWSEPAQKLRGITSTEQQLRVWEFEMGQLSSLWKTACILQCSGS